MSNLQPKGSRAVPQVCFFNKNTNKNVWVPVTDVHIDKDGYLQIFSINFPSGTEHYHSVRHTAMFWATLGAAIWGTATTLNSSKTLMEKFNKIAGREEWFKKAGYTGIAFGSAASLTAWLKTRPYQKEGYYNANNELLIGALINTKDREDYLP